MMHVNIPLDIDGHVKSHPVKLTFSIRQHGCSMEQRPDPADVLEMYFEQH